MKSEGLSKAGISFAPVGDHSTDPFAKQDPVGMAYENPFVNATPVAKQDKITIRVVDFLEEFTKAIWDSLNQGEEKYGDSWLDPVDEDFEVETHSINEIKLKFRKANLVVGDKPINWAAVAGYAMIAWIRKNHPEVWPKRINTRPPTSR